MTSGTSGRKLKRVVSRRVLAADGIEALLPHASPPPGEMFMLLGPIDESSARRSASRLRASGARFRCSRACGTRAPGRGDCRASSRRDRGRCLLHHASGRGGPRDGRRSVLLLRAAGRDVVRRAGRRHRSDAGRHRHKLRRQRDHRRIRAHRGLAAGRKLPAIAGAAHPRRPRRGRMRRPRLARAIARGRDRRDRVHEPGGRHPAAASLPQPRYRQAELQRALRLRQYGHPDRGDRGPHRRHDLVPRRQLLPLGGGEHRPPRRRALTRVPHRP